MRHPFHTLFALAVFSASLVFLPACGRKTVRSEQWEPTPGASSSTTPTPVPVLYLETPTESPTAEVLSMEEPTATPTLSAYTYVPETVTMEQDPETAKPKKRLAAAKSLGDVLKPKNTPTPLPEPTAVPPTPLPTVVPVTASHDEPTMVEETKKGGISGFTWVMIVLLVILGIWYLLERRKESKRRLEMPVRPAPPLGGLSPLSGFHAPRARARAATRAGKTPRKKRG